MFNNQDRLSPAHQYSEEIARNVFFLPIEILPGFIEEKNFPPGRAVNNQFQKLRLSARKRDHFPVFFLSEATFRPEFMEKFLIEIFRFQ